MIILLYLEYYNEMISFYQVTLKTLQRERESFVLLKPHQNLTYSFKDSPAENNKMQKEFHTVIVTKLHIPDIQLIPYPLNRLTHSTVTPA